MRPIFSAPFFSEHKRQYESEFIALDAGDKAAVRQAGAQPVRHLAQDLVPCGVAEEIVDRLEPVDICNSDGERRGIICPLGRQFPDLVHEPAAIAQTGQGVCVGYRFRIGGHIAPWFRLLGS